MPRFIIADPSLKDVRGHHFSLSSAAAKSAAAAGLEPWWFCSQKVGDEFASGVARIRPTFRAGMYDNYVLAKSARANELTFLERAKAKLARARNRKLPPETKSEIDQADVFARDLICAIDECGLNQDDRILIHTADGAVYVALANIVENFPLENLPILHVVTPYDPVGVMPNRRSHEVVNDAVSALVTSGVVGAKVFLYGENEFLSRHLASIWNTAVRAHALPAMESDDAERQFASDFRKGALAAANEELVIVSLGSARIEKGFHWLPAIVKQSAEILEPSLRGKLRFAFHASPQIIGRLPAIAKAIDELEAIGAPLVTLLKDHQTESDYRSMLLSADAVLLPYGQSEYLRRSSGIVTEAVAAGKPIIATADSYPGLVAAAAGGLTATTPQEFADAIAQFVRDPDRYAAAARLAQSAELIANSVEDYVPKLLRNEHASS